MSYKPLLIYTALYPTHFEKIPFNNNNLFNNHSFVNKFLKNPNLIKQYILSSRSYIHNLINLKY